MANKKSTTDWDLEYVLQKRIRPFSEHAPWILRITDRKDKPAPVFIVKRRVSPNGGVEVNGTVGRSYLKEQGLLYGLPLRRIMQVVSTITGRVCDVAGIPLELQRFFNNGRITFRGNLPLDEEAGVKLSLIFKLQERMKDMDRVELIARRVERFSREEATYWLTRATQYGVEGNRWALAGMRIMLGGQPDDKAVLRMLEKLRS
jgi:hypothetical protein